MTRVLLCMWMFVQVVACAHPPPPPLLSNIQPELALSLSHQRLDSTAQRRKQVVAKARALLRGAPTITGGLHFTPDPVGFARATYWEVGIDLFEADVYEDGEAHGMEILYRSAAARQSLHRHTPEPGDMVFFQAEPKDTSLYPQQVAVVERVVADGTIWAIGMFAGGPARVRLNLRQPERTHDEDGLRINDRLAGEPSIALAQVFRSFADPFR